MKRMRKAAIAVISAAAIMTCGVPAFANVNEDVLTFLKEEAIPEAYMEVAYPQFEKIVAQLDIEQDQFDTLKGMYADLKAEVADQGKSVSDYSKADQDKIIAKLDEACALLGVTYTVEGKAGVAGDVIATFFKDGVKIGTIDMDIDVAKTDVID
ncbi:MAG: hypothetical protein KBT01_03495 [Clostridiales bacterium]|nr:hypothetical protein [Candidatus Blautia equi]